MPDTEHGNGGQGMAPYIAFASLKSFIQSAKPHALPSRIDRSVIPATFSGAVKAQIIGTLRFLGLIVSRTSPPPRWRGLLRNSGLELDPALGSVLRSAYPTVFELNLETATPQQFGERFRKAYPGAEAVQRKSITFFLNAAREAQIGISPHITKNKKPRSGTTKRRAKPATNGVVPSVSDQKKSDELPSIVSTSSEFMAQLLAKFPTFDPNWPDPIKTEWFKGFQQFMEHAKQDE